MFSGNKLSFAVIAILICACAQKKARLWIEPPVGHSGTNSSSRNIFYRVEDAHTGKKESLYIPLNQPPQNLVVETNNKGGEGEENIAVTKADEFLHQGKLPEAQDKKLPPTLSYLRGIQEVERLFAGEQHNEALVRLTPLLEQYPDQPRLYLMQGTLYRKIGEKKMALLSFKRAQELDKDNPLIEEALMRTQDDLGGTP